MKRRDIYKYIKTQFGFDFYKERIIYRYVCKEKVGKKDKKRLSEEERCTTYHQWKRHLEEKFKYYSEEGLVELNKLFNLLQRDTRNNSEYSKSICLSVTVIFLTVIVENLLEYIIQSSTLNIDIHESLMTCMIWVSIIFVCIMVLVIILTWIVYKMNLDYIRYGRSEYFISDVQSVLLKLIKDV